VKRIFTKTVVKKSRDKVQFKSDACLIKILSSLVANAKRILFNLKWKFNQIVSFKESIEDKKKRILFERKVFSLSQSTRIETVKIKKQSLIKNELRMFQSTMKFVQKSEFRFFKKNDLMTFVQFLRSTNSTKMFIAYKRKDQKMKFSDICVSDDFKSDDDVTWKENIIKKKKYFKDFTNQFAEFLISKFSELTKEARLKLERIQRMQIKNELLKREKEFFLEMLFNREIALFWNFIEKDSVRSKVTSFMKIRTMSHEAWQILEFQILKTLIEIVAKMIKNRIKNDVLEFCYESYQNSWFLVKKKKKEKYRLINVVLKMNRIIIRNANLLSAINEFFEKFVDCAIVSLVNLFFEYDQLSLIEKCRDMIVFMISLDLVRMITILMRTINFVT
jgi:hypothetical protein